LVTTAFTVTADKPAVVEANLFEMLTEIGGGTRVKLKLSLFVVSALEVAVIVG